MEDEQRKVHENTYFTNLLLKSQINMIFLCFLFGYFISVFELLFALLIPLESL